MISTFFISSIGYSAYIISNKVRSIHRSIFPLNSSISKTFEASCNSKEPKKKKVEKITTSYFLQNTNIVNNYNIRLQYKVIFCFTKGTTYCNVIRLLNNKTIYSISTGQLGFKRKQRKSPAAHYALTKALALFLKKINTSKIKFVLVFKGIYLGKLFIRQNLKQFRFLKVIEFIDLTQPPHNGCRLPVKRRL